MQPNSSPYSTLILIALMVVAFYFLIIRPNKKRQQAQLKTMNSLTPGTRVLLTSGVFGTLVEVGDRQAVLELSPGVHLTVLKQAIARTVQPSDEDSPEDDEDFDDELESETDDSLTQGGSHLATDPSPSHHPTTPNGANYPSTPDQDPRTGTSSTPIKD
jgi:preprotein translocase subunit YajC